jgi:carotenoid cleavage dioxygenase-like enzyme
MLKESRFVPRTDARTEDDGFLLFYVFNKAQLDESGECRADARSELWIVDARNMKTVIGKVILPQRVPYGFAR